MMYNSDVCKCTGPLATLNYVYRVLEHKKVHERSIHHAVLVLRYKHREHKFCCQVPVYIPVVVQAEPGGL